jgi:peptide/nickel transport system ATP-binding protein
VSERAPLFELRELSVRLRPEERPLLKGLSLTVAAGEVVGLMGASGAGKSLTARAILGLLPSARFRVGWQRLALSGTAIAPGSQAERGIRGTGIGLIFQEPLAALNPVLRVGTQIAEGLIRHARFRRRAAWRQAIEWLGRVGIPEPEQAAKRHPHQLSGGQRQRVAIAQVLALGPQLIIADEPTSALDPLLAEEFLALLTRETRAHGRGLLLISHDLALLSRHADRIEVLAAGCIVEGGPARALLAAPRHPATRRAVAAALLPPPPPAPPRHETEVPLLEVVKLAVDAPAPWFGRARPILRGVDLVLPRGAALGLVGPSGSGKSTLARAILGLGPVRSGAIRFAGQELTALRPTAWRPLRRRLQIIFQDPWASLDPRMRVADLIAEGPRLHGLARSPAARLELAAEALAAVGLGEAFLHRYPHELSGGQRQRVAIARALALKPELLVLDEAVSALDPALKLEILELLAALRARFGLSLLFIAHDLAAVRHLCDRLAVMSEGRIVESGPTEALLTAPAHPLTRRLLQVSRLGEGG